MVAKTGVTAFTDKGNGYYTREYVANKTTTSSNATVTLNGTTSSPYVYAIKSNPAVKANSTITVTNTLMYDDLTITVKLQDAYQNPVLGEASNISSLIKVPSIITLKSGTTWAENNGTYTATYTANNHSTTTLTATLKLSNWTDTLTSNAFTINTQSVDYTKGYFTASPTIIMSNGTDKMTVTFVAQDSKGRTIPTEIDGLIFRFLHSNSSTLSNLFPTDATFNSATGQYVGAFHGGTADTYTIRALVGSQYFTPTVKVSMYKYSLNVDTSYATSLIYGKTAPINLHAIPSDNASANELITVWDNTVTSSSSNTKVGTLSTKTSGDGSGLYFTAKYYGDTTISASLTYKGFNLSNSSVITVPQPGKSPSFGIGNDQTASYIAQPDNYTMWARHAMIVDAFGVSSSDYVGNKGGGTSSTIPNIRNVKSVDIYIGNFGDITGIITQMKFYYNDGISLQLGTTGGTKTNYPIASDEMLVGFDVKAKKIRTRQVNTTELFYSVE